MIFAIILPLVQLGVFCWIIYHGMRLITKSHSDMTELVDKLGEAFIEDRQTYRLIGELIQEERKNALRKG